MSPSITLINDPPVNIPYSANKGKEENLLELASIDSLPNEILAMIFRFSTNNCKEIGKLCRFREVSKNWNRVLEYELLEPYWKKLQNTWPLYRNLAAKISQIDHSVSDLLANEPEPGASALPFECPYFSRFTNLSLALAGSSQILGLEVNPYEQIQKNLNTSLEKIWMEIQNKIHFEGADIPTSASSIRKWLNDPTHAQKIARITTLDLAGMNLTILPPEIGMFSQLTDLKLFNNQLTTLPKEIGCLFQLTWLDLSVNRLTSLPEAIGNLSLLKRLFLSKNELKSLPNTIGNLSQLIYLNISHNRLTNLPDSLGNLFQLTELYLTNAYQLIFLLDKNFRARIDFQKFNSQQIADKHLACSSYHCRSALAALCQKIHCGKGDAALRSSFEKLPDEMKERIYQAAPIRSSSSSLPSKKAALFADKTHFAKALITALQTKWNAFSEDQRCQAYAYVAILARQPEADAEWGKAHAEENIIRLIDAIAAAEEGNSKKRAQEPQ